MIKLEFLILPSLNVDFHDFFFVNKFIFWRHLWIKHFSSISIILIYLFKNRSLYIFNSVRLYYIQKSFSKKFNYRSFILYFFLKIYVLWYFIWSFNNYIFHFQHKLINFFLPSQIFSLILCDEEIYKVIIIIKFFLNRQSTFFLNKITNSIQKNLNFFVLFLFFSWKNKHINIFSDTLEKTKKIIFLI